MLFITKRHGLKNANVWLELPEKIDYKKYPIWRFFNVSKEVDAPKNVYALNRRQIYTLLSDLRQSGEELLSLCKSNVRNEIRRAEKDGATWDLIRSFSDPENVKLIGEFQKEYDAMHESKGMAKPNVTGLMRALSSVGGLAISRAMIGEYTVAYHVYAVGEKTVRLLYSVSVFRDHIEGLSSSEIGRANRMLHYKDMLAFKEAGLETYDWGGVSDGSDPALNHIDQFKLAFGGTQATVYHAEFASSKLWYRLYKTLKK